MHAQGDLDIATPAGVERAISDTVPRITPAAANTTAQTEDNVASNTPGRAYHRLNLDLETDFWGEYVNQADALDREMVKTLSEDLNTLLIFVSSLSLHWLIH